MEYPDRTVLVCMMQRSGSTMLCRRLADTGLVDRCCQGASRLRDNMSVAQKNGK